MYCVTSVTYSVLINETAHGYIVPERGLRQGDPLSPFLFILCAEALVSLLNKAEERGALNGVKASRSGPSVHHLLFADDSLLLCKATKGEILELQRYLGLPECFNGSKVQLLNFIKENLESRLNGWYAKTLSQGGKEVLLKSVAMSLPVYAMSCFKLPKETICRRKELGGLGFRDIGRFNQALLGKQAWRIHDNPSSLLAQILKHRYFRRKTFFQAGSGTRPSFAWRSILFGRELLRKGLFKVLGNGQNITVWSDNWLPDVLPRPPAKPPGPHDENLSISDLLVPNSSAWNIPILRHFFEEQDVKLILQTKVLPDKQDVISWYFSKNGQYTTQTGYKLSETLIETTISPPQIVPHVEQRLWSRLWRLKTTPKIQHFIWRAIKGALAVKVRLLSRGIQSDISCPSCHLSPESVCHALFNCPIATQVWSIAKLPMPRSGFSQSSTLINLHHLMACIDKKSLEPQFRRAIPWVLWNIWKARNSFVFDNTRLSAESLVQKAQNETEDWFIASALQDHSTDRIGNSPAMARRWTKPPLGHTKCNIGSAWIDAQSKCGVSWILRDHLGNSILHSRRAFPYVQTQLEADLISLRWAIRDMVNLPWRDVISPPSYWLVALQI